MKAEEIREGDIVEIDYITEFRKEHINEGKALVIWKGFNNQPLVRKLNTRATIWTSYEHIARVIGHTDIDRYMDDALNTAEAINKKEINEVLEQIQAEILDFKEKCNASDYLGCGILEIIDKYKAKSEE